MPPGMPPRRTTKIRRPAGGDPQVLAELVLERDPDVQEEEDADLAQAVEQDP